MSLCAFLVSITWSINESNLSLGPREAFSVPCGTAKLCVSGPEPRMSNALSAVTVVSGTHHTVYCIRPPGGSTPQPCSRRPTSSQPTARIWRTAAVLRMRGCGCAADLLGSGLEHVRMASDNADARTWRRRRRAGVQVESRAGDRRKFSTSAADAGRKSQPKVRCRIGRQHSCCCCSFRCPRRRRMK
jgi:hypothetical protein